MFLALRDLRAARGRFALITVTVAMMALLVSFLSGLTGGLVHQNISSLQTLGGTTAYVGNEDIERSNFTIPSRILDAHPATAVAMSRGNVNGDGVAVLAVRAGKQGPADPATPLPEPGQAVVSQSAAKTIDVAVGDTITLNKQQLKVTAISGDDWYAHQEVVWTNLEEGTPATVVVTDGPQDHYDGLTSMKTSKLPSTIASYKAESTSLNMINVMLLIITALVTGAFFTVWTIQRKPDIATLKALGATTSALVVDALGQAMVILAIGVGIGLAITLAAAAAIGDAMPFIVSTSTTVVPAVAMFVLGLVGAGLSLSFLRSASALSALGGNR